MNLKLVSQEKSTAVVDFIVGRQEVVSEINHTLEHLALTTAVKGFRKGKAPLNLVKLN
jgi:FKBP-type peptidyl-prolyl cis-trans isomerase (trigger factor)